MLKKPQLLFLLFGAFMLTNALVAEFIGVKIFSLEGTLGLVPMEMNFFGAGPLSFNLTAGVLLWPWVFVVTDLVNEYFGRRGVRLLSYMIAGLIAYAFLMVALAIRMSPAGFWQELQVGDGGSPYPAAFNAIFGQGLWIIVGSLVAFLIGQMVDVWVFHRIRRLTGEKAISLRATGSTLVSQFIDSFVVLFIAFYLGQGWSFGLVMAICFVNYIYKVVMALILTPVVHLAHIWVDKWLGPAVAQALKLKASHGG